MLFDRFAAPMELSFVGDGQPGAFEGYGAVFGNTDFYGHVITQGAFAETLAKHVAAGSMPGMYAEHSAYELGGDPLPIGVWQAMSEDSKGLHVKGKISALDTDHSKRIIGLMRDKAIAGLSIAFKVPAGGDVRGKKEGEPKRTINRLDLHSVDLVRDPANAMAQVLHLNAVMKSVDAQACQAAVAACMKLHQQSLSGQNSPTTDQRSQMLGHLMDAHRALTGSDTPTGWMMSKPKTVREYEGWLREEFSLSHSQARAIAELGFIPPRDEAVEEKAAKEARAETLKELSLIVSSLTSKG
jgi:HK97 family phage prohead protease